MATTKMIFAVKALKSFEPRKLNSIYSMLPYGANALLFPFSRSNYIDQKLSSAEINRKVRLNYIQFTVYTLQFDYDLECW